MKYILFCLILLLSTGGTAHSQTDRNQLNDRLTELASHIKYSNYKLAYTTAKDILETCDSIPETVTSICLQTYCLSGHYEECIESCNLYIKSDPGSIFSNSLLTIIGDCYYHIGEYRQALEYYDRHLEFNKARGIDDSPSALSRYAEIKFNLFKWEEAESVFKSIIDKKLAEDSLSLSGLCNCDEREWYGKIFQKYAMTCLIQGKEDIGMKLLSVSSDCGNPTAKIQYSKLYPGYRYFNNGRLNNKTRNSFEICLDKYEMLYPSYGPEQKRIYDAGKFWDYVTCHDQELMQLKEAAGKRKKPKSLYYAADQLQSNSYSLNKLLSSYTLYTPGNIESNLNKNLFAGQQLITGLYIYKSPHTNAFATPFGQIYLSDSLVDLYDCCTPLLLAVCAHEATHYLCRHTLIQLWEQEKKRIRNEVLAGIAIGLNSAAQSFSAAYSATASGYNYNQWSFNENLSRMNSMIYYAFAENSYYFQFKYSRGQELEADFIAYRFCEAMGIGGYAYILALELLGNNTMEMKADKESDHPTLAYRIRFLKYIHEKENSKSMK